MSPGQPSGVVFSVLGPLRVEGPRQEIRVGGVRRRGVLLRLLASPGRPVPVDVLAEDVWDGAPPAAAASTLQSHVSALRQAVGAARLDFCDGGYRLEVGPAELDSLMFEADVAAGQAAMSAGDFGSAAVSLDRALSMWRGQAFADVSGASWSMIPASHLEETRNAAVEDALETHLALGHHHEVCVMAEEAVAAEPLRERRWAALMLAQYRMGRQADALGAYRRLRDTLADQLGLDPSPRLSQLEQDILIQSPGLEWAGGTPSDAVEARAMPGAPTPRSNLPAPVGGFVGRVNELAELSKLVGRDRLVTVTGTGGVGKTRLALEVSRASLGEYRDGVWFVDLAELTDPAGLPAAIADAIGLRQVPGQLIDELLTEHVTGMRALLILDNCEHLVSAAAMTVERILEAGAGVRVLATSRQPLRVLGERVWQTPPIAFPDIHDLNDQARLASFDAVRLFLDRAPELTDASSQDLRMIAEITARLDGLPLAIELVAARTGMLDLDQLAAVLQDRISLSWLRSGTAHARHQTLAATIGWSYDLLTPRLQAALKPLAVFSGGFTLEAATAVIGGSATTEKVAALAERSLIVASRGAHFARPGPIPTRYRMLETIRQYCVQRIAEEHGPDGEQAAREAHSSYYAGLARRASAALTGWHQGRWLTILETDHANLVVAINYLLTRPSRAGEALQMIVHLDRFWHNRGHLAECAVLLRRGLHTAGPDIPAALRCGALALAGQAALRYDGNAAYSYFTQSLEIARRARDDFHSAKALWGLASLGDQTGDVDKGSTAGEDAVNLARALGDPTLLGECLVAFGTVAGNSQAQQTVYREALTVTRRSGDRIWAGWAHNNLSNALNDEDDIEAARQHLEEARAIFRELGVHQPEPVASLGWRYLMSGNTQAADATLIEALDTCELIQNRYVTSYVIFGLACSAAAQHEWERAACLFGFADAELEHCGMSWPEGGRTHGDQVLAEVRQHLAHKFDRHYDSGHTADRAALIDTALRHQPIRGHDDIASSRNHNGQ